MVKNTIFILLFTLFAFSSIAWSEDASNDLNSLADGTMLTTQGASGEQDQSDGEGWYLQGEPVITKDKEIDLPPCTTNRKVSVNNGKGHSSVDLSSSYECYREGGGIYDGDVTWTKPPIYMKPGSNISFSMTFTSPPGIPTSGLIGAAGRTIVEGDSRNPGGFSKANYTVPQGSPGAELVLYANFVGVSGLHGDVVYNYEYKQPDPERPDPRSSKTFDPGSLRPRVGLHIEELDGDVYVIRDGLEIPADEGFQLREGDTIKVLPSGYATICNESMVYWGCANGIPGKIMMITIPTKEALKKLELTAIEEGRALARFMVRMHGLAIFTQFGVDMSESAQQARLSGFERKSYEDFCGVRMKYGTVEDVHTSFVCLQTSAASIVLVLNGTVKFISNVSDEDVLVNAGQMAIATTSGLSPLESFDVEAVKSIFEPYIPSTRITVPKESKVIYDSWNLGSVDNGPTCSPLFTLDEPQMITYADTYHWNYGKGQASGGTISLKNGGGETFGPWSVTLESGSGISNVWWIAHPNEVIPAGTYTIVDSDPETWSKNPESPCGFAKVEGYAA